MHVTACRAMVGALLVTAQTIAAGRRDELERTVGQESAPLAGPMASEQTLAAVRWPRVQPPARPWAGYRQRDAAETSSDEPVASQVAEVPPVPAHPRSEAAMDLREVLKVPEGLEMLTASLTLTAVTVRTPLPQAVWRE